MDDVVLSVRSFPCRASTGSLFCLVLAASWLTLAAVAMAAETAKPEGVLILHSNQRPLPAAIIVEDTLRTVVPGELGRPVELLSEYLDDEQFATAAYVEAQAELLQRKYGRRNIRVVVAVAPPAFRFMLDHRDRILPGVPVVHLAVPRDLQPERGLPPDFVGATIDLDPKATFELALRLQPATKRLVIVTGSSDRDRIWERRIRDAVGRLGDRLEVEYLTGLPTAEVLRRLGALSRNTIVYTPGYFADGAGLVITPRQSVEQMAAASTAPLYGSISTFLGAGAVGGYMPLYEDQAKQAATFVVRLLNGDAPAAIPASSIHNIPVVDWRQLRRWRIDEKLLPSGSIVRFRTPSMWDQYQWYVIGVLIIVAIQAAMIAGLLYQRARRRRTEAELGESRYLMELASNAGGFGMWMRDLSEGHVWANTPLRTQFGFGRDDALRLGDLIARIHPEDRVRVAEALQSAQERGLLFEGEFRVVPPDGTERWVMAKGWNVSDSRLGPHPRRMGVAIDITQRKQAERESARQRNELAHLSRVSALGQLSASIAHQLNQPLAAILGNAEAAHKMLGREPVDHGELREICADIVTEDHRAAEVISRLRSLFKEGESRSQSIDVNELIRETLDLLRTDLVLRRVTPGTDLDSTLPAIDGDRVQLQQVLLNLIVNAADAMNGTEEGKRILTIRTGANGSDICLCVTDCGTGIEPKHLKKVFEPFWSTKPEGVGIGLALCRTIVAAHRGTLTAVNNDERGATFCINLPVRADA